ncbi:transcriptional regulatory protein AfsQ1 [Lachnospiraceae bacterium]|nr:transcriptional regulatory protein AfsQ1 [Lachnospiraceae bacterium]
MSKSKNVHDKNQNKKMLIVEDKAINRYVLRGIFEDEYKIAECQDGRVAIELLEESRDEIVAVLLDLVMPVCDGFAVLKYMKETSLYNVPVILISSNVNDINLHKVSAYDIVVDYIQKPFQENIVRQRVQRAIKLYQKKENIKYERAE